MKELKPCPFCGRRASTEKLLRHSIRFVCLYFRVGCETAGCPGFRARSYRYDTEEAAIKAWNTRLKV